MENLQNPSTSRKTKLWRIVEKFLASFLPLCGSVLWFIHDASRD
jgi:hypothetical protein